jgi:N-acetylglucosaminyldiphosphoundecaprenol N-acetyl-beta-D-mannosaminyltransferase
LEVDLMIQTREVLGVKLSIVDYGLAVAAVMEAARRRRSFGVAALAVHGVMTGALDRTHRYRLNALDLLVPDGQPVRWALNLLHSAQLDDRVYGPTLMLRTAEAAAAEGFPIFLFGSRLSVLEALAMNLRCCIPSLQIAGMRPSAFQRVSPATKAGIIHMIKDSGARIVFVGLGCPRQEVWVYEHLNALAMPMLAVGAAFDIHAGRLPQAPRWMQQRGLEWLFRLYQEPGRLWQRYLLLNPLYVALVALRYIGVPIVRSDAAVAPIGELRFS